MSGTSYIRVEIDADTVVYMRPGSNYAISGAVTTEKEDITEVMIEGLGAPIQVLNIKPQRIRELFEEAITSYHLVSSLT